MKAMIPAPLSRARLAFWLITPALTGAVIMALELAAFRLYAPHFGYSIYVWGSMISVVMLALACGYGAGGWLADRCATDSPLYAMILLSGVYQFVIICIARSLLAKLAEMGDSTGTSLATLIIFAPPMIALATVGPFIIRLLARFNRVGATAGLVYALSTIGSVAGVLGTTFFLIPKFGTQATLLTACALSALVGVTGLLTMKRLAFFALLPVALYPISPQPLWSENALWMKESAYNLVRVIRDRQRLALTLNDESSMHTVLDKTNRWTGHYYDYFALGPLLVDANNALVLGMGAGASIATIRETAPDVQIDAVE